MWLIAETADGNAIEYWLGGKCVLSIPCDSDNLDLLNKAKALLTELKAKPRGPGDA